MASKKDPVEHIEFINLLCRLGVSYHFDDEIENSLKQIFDDLPNLLEKHDFDLYTLSLLFRVLRQHGFKMPCGERILPLYSLWNINQHLQKKWRIEDWFGSWRVLIPFSFKWNGAFCPKRRHYIYIYKRVGQWRNRNIWKKRERNTGRGEYREDNIERTERRRETKEKKGQWDRGNRRERKTHIVRRERKGNAEEQKIGEKKKKRFISLH